MRREESLGQVLSCPYGKHRGLLRIADAFGSADTEDLFTYLDIWLAAGSS